MSKFSKIERVREGDWMFMPSGRKMWPLDPDPQDFFIEDIAHNLAQICRYNGSTACRSYNPSINKIMDFEPIFYSVAQHSVYCSLHESSVDPLEKLMHDAAESILGDWIRPIKRHPKFQKLYRPYEIKAEKAIAARFGLKYPWSKDVHAADEAVTTAEVEHLILSSDKGKLHDDRVCSNVKIVSWTPLRAKEMFLTRFRQLNGLYYV